MRRHREVEYDIQPVDVHWNGFQASVILLDEWEPFGVTAIPNIMDPESWIRVWLRQRANFKNHKPYEILIQNAGWGGHEVFLHLSQLWVPFGVSDSYDNHIIWFYKEVEK